MTTKHAPASRMGRLRVEWVSDSIGVGLFTADPIGVNETILTELPHVSMLEFGEEANDHCEYCLRHMDSLTRLPCVRHCSSYWCSTRCRDISEASGHSHLCAGGSPLMRDYFDEAKASCNEYFVLAARLFAAPPTSQVNPACACAVAASDSSPQSAIASNRLQPAAGCSSLSHVSISSICLGLKGAPWWLTVEPSTDDPEEARQHCEGARALTVRQCERLLAVLPPSSAGALTPDAMAIAMGSLRMNVIGVCVERAAEGSSCADSGGCARAGEEEEEGDDEEEEDAEGEDRAERGDAERAEGSAVLGMGLFDLTSRANHSCVPSARLCYTTGDSRVAAATLVACRELSSGEEVTIDYLAGVTDKAEKRALLREQYLFDCTCESCVILTSAPSAGR